MSLSTSFAGFPVRPDVAVKICGLTSIPDALAAIDAGADYLGLIFVPNTPRCVILSQAREIAEAVRSERPDANFQIVGVFRNPLLQELETLTSAIPLDILQLHGSPLESNTFTETPAFCRTLKSAFGKPILKMLPVLPTTEPLILLRPYVEESDIDAVLLEPLKNTSLDLPALLAETPGLLAQIEALFQYRPCFLAGRLTLDNIGALLANILPYGVDTASGVERALPHISSPQKDPLKMQAFCSQVRTIASSLQGENPTCNL